MRGFDGLDGKVHAVKILGEKKIGDLIGQVFDIRSVIQDESIAQIGVTFFESIVDLNQERSAAAGRIANFDLP